MRASLKEYQAVEAAALKRLNGVAEGDSAIARDAFSEEAMVYGCLSVLLRPDSKLF